MGTEQRGGAGGQEGCAVSWEESGGLNWEEGVLFPILRGWAGLELR